MKLRALQSGLTKIPAILKPAPTQSDQRIAGRTLQNRRLRKWTQSPYCSHCGQLTEYPQGFELDHIHRLDQGGPDTDENTQVLCVWWEAGAKMGCHAKKTADEVKKPW